MNKLAINYKKLIQGRYEAERLPADMSAERNVPDFSFNFLNPLGLLYRPVVDEDYLQNGGQKPRWPDEKPFAVCLTHDVDMVSSPNYSFSQSSKIHAYKLRNKGSSEAKIHEFIDFGIDTIRAIKHANAHDPLHCYERWLEVEEKFGARSTFFFWPGWNAIGKHHPTDCSYNLEDRVVIDRQKCTVAEMIREIDRRKWEIGLHPSWYSYNDANEMKRQKETLEKAVGHEVVSVRQHCLHYDIRVTPRIQAEAGFKYDSTLGFNDNVGFRFGTCYPWRLYDLEAEQAFPIFEIPLIIQDVALLNRNKGLRLDADTAFKYIMQITDQVEKVGGVLTLLWHPNSIVNLDYWSLFSQTLKYLSEKNAWFAPIKDVGDWFQRRPGSPL